MNKFSFIRSSFLAVFVLLVFSIPTQVFSAEPSMADYTHIPNFMVESVKPNILVILDNSGSMNFNAYGPDKSNGELVGDSYFGYPFQNISMSADSDAEEEKSDGLTRTSHYDLDFGYSSSAYPNQAIGVRFAGIYIPQGAEITNAYIEFTASEDHNTSAANLPVAIYGDDVSDAGSFVDGTDNADVTSRDRTSSRVDWNMTAWGTTGSVYATPNIKAIVQEIVDREDWKEGNSIAFTINTRTDPAGNFRSAYSEDSSGTSPRLVVEIGQSSAKDYYGYFNPDYLYTYNNNKFVHKYKKQSFSSGTWTVSDLSGTSTKSIDAGDFSSEGLWDGNWMNWMTMRRIDVLRKVLMGGKATSRQGTGNQVLQAEVPAQSSRYFDRIFDSSSVPISPYSGSHRYRIRDGYIYIDTNNNGSFDTNRTLDIDKEEAYDPESFGDDHNLGGIFQDYYDRAHWGLEFFNTGTGNNGDGGTVERPIGDNANDLASMLTQFQNKQCDTNTPLAESFYVATQYFKQEDPDSSFEYPNGAAPNANDGDDPYIHDGEEVYCAKSFVLLLTDGSSTRDGNIPMNLRDYDSDGDNTSCDESSGSNCDYGSGGTDYLDDVALYARINDLRSDLPDNQNLILYNVFALSDDENARKLLKDASRNGGFEDHNGNGVPDGDYDDPPEDRLEWDRDGDAVPDTYFEATDGEKLKDELSRAIEDILRRAASGTAVSVISTSTEGDGSLVQAFFRPVVEIDSESMTWAGYLQSLWVDSRGNIREDTNNNQALDLNVDRIIVFDELDNQTIVKRYDVSGSAYPDLTDSNLVDYVYFDEVPAIWSAGELLAQRNPDNRDIFTFTDVDGDQVIDVDDIIDFDSTNISDLTPYLGVAASDWDYLGDTAASRASNLIEYIRGSDSGLSGTTNVRNRTIDGETWKLGDIVYSTPVIVAAPQERFDQIYADSSYLEYYNLYKDRETVIYAGANDGMLHAFTSWYYDKSLQKFTNTLPQPDGSTVTTSDDIGTELWAYIPQTLLPHLKWLADPDYTHVHYVDLTAKVFDAKILPDNVHYIDADSEKNWGTFLLVGLNYGGKHIWSTGDFDGDGSPETRHFYPTYTLIDVTDPRNPEVLWERTYSMPVSPAENSSNDTDLGLTMQMPAVSKVNDKWFAIFGSGPKDYSGESLRNGHVYVVDLATGIPYQNGTNDWLFETADPRAMMASASSFDKNLNYSVDSIFIGESYDGNAGSGLDWDGAMYKIRVPWSCTSSCYYYGDIANGSYDDDPANWVMSKIFSSERPVTSAPTLSIDNRDNSWVYFGTGRYLTEADKSTTEVDYLIGIKDPFFDAYADDSATYYLKTTANKVLDLDDLFYANDFGVASGGTVYEMPAETVWTGGGFSHLEAEAATYDGWKRALTNSTGERNLSKSSIIGGTLVSTSFAPAEAICTSGGNSYLYGLYYLTGTAYKRAVFSSVNDVTIGSGDDAGIRNVESISLGRGLSSAPTIHVGRQENDEVTVLYQKSTGEVGRLNIDPALRVRSGLKLWREERTE